MDSFQQRKKDVLSRKDKSSIGEWDKKIIPICNKINSLENFYTTSSCSGRIILMIDQDKKREGLFLKSYHNKVSFDKLKKDLKEIVKKNKNQIIKFKLEPCIIHIVCKSLDDAKFTLELANNSGWKNHFIISLGKNPIIELSGTERIEFPIFDGKNILVDDKFLKIVLKKANEKLENGWKKIERLKKELK
jgi:tRNA wybutosine-synthesizing protein 3